MANIKNLVDDINIFFSNIEEGDVYQTSDPYKEQGLQLDLYCYLRDLGYAVVYELELPNLQQYLRREMNESLGMFGYEAGSLRPDLVVNLGADGFACFELKYDENNLHQLEEDAAKSRIYVKHCTDVHYAGYLNFYQLKYKRVEYDGEYCADPDYLFSFYCYTDNPKTGLMKSRDAYMINRKWEQKAIEIENGEGEFSKYGY